MQPGHDLLGNLSSFTARRSAASNLPNFEIPPRPLIGLNSKYSFGTIANSQTLPSSGSISNIGNLLTPPNTLPDGSLSPISQALAHGTSNNNATNTSYQSGYWNQPTHSNSQYNFPSQSSSQWPQQQRSFSPNSLVRAATVSQGASDVVSSSQSEMFQLPPFTSSLSMSGQNTLPAMSVAQQRAVTDALINGHGTGPVTHPQNSSMNSQDAYLRQPPTPNYYSQAQHSPNVQNQNYTYHTDSSNSTLSPLSVGNHQNRHSPHQSGSEIPRMQSNTLHQSSPSQFQRPFGQFSLPALNGPVMSNLHSPNNQMSMVNGIMPSFTSGHAASMHHMYGVPHPSQQNQVATDRPFRCDQCLQSFNRNHDLKRHKRIHLAVKPYPCKHCDKSFSRKDALKVSNTAKTVGVASKLIFDSVISSSKGAARPGVAARPRTRTVLYRP